MTSEKQMVNSLNEVIMPEEAMLANMIATTALSFIDTFDKSGKPYILHCLKVMHYLEPHGAVIQTAGCGHDLFEDTDVTAHDLLKKGYPDRVIEAIKCVTKMPGQSYGEYKESVMSNDDAILVKMADIRHNSDLRRLKGVRQKDFDRHVEYMAFYYELERRAVERGLIRV